MERKDSINLIKVMKILDERGWLGKNVVGTQGNQTLFLVIQHADLEYQQKYLPMMREAVKDGNANPANQCGQGPRAGECSRNWALAAD